MSSAALVLTNIGTDEWDAEVYAVLAMASRLAALVKDRTQTVQLAYRLWKLNRTLSAFFKELRDNVEGKNPQANPVQVTPERIEDAIRGLREVHIKLETLYESARRARLTNNSLLAMPIRSIHTYSDDILEIVELLEAYQHSEDVNAVFDRAAQERERGEIYDLVEIE